MKNVFLITCITILWVSCDLKEETISFDPTLELIFSNDSVAFDTLLSETQSSTKRLTVFNPNTEAIQLSNIYLGLGSSSDYTVIINGRETNSLMNERLLGGDSLLILVGANVSARDRNEPYLVKDSIVFEWNTNRAHVKLVTYGQDGNRLGKQVLCDEVWTSDRPYIISDTLLVGAGCNLTVQSGTKVFFENDAALFIQGSMQVMGESANRVVFRNSRFDGVYDETPGQWNGIYFLEGSNNNQIAYTDIFNAQIGLRVGTPDDDDLPDVVLSNSKIFNMSFAGILAFTSDIEVVNSMVTNCGTYLIGNFAGGNYRYDHCSFSNETSFFIQDEPSVQFSDNIVLGDGEVISSPLDVRIRNTIIWGSQPEELSINNGAGESLTTLFLTNIIRSGEVIENNFTSQEYNFPGFRYEFSSDLSLDTLAFAKDKASDIGVLIDIQGNDRGTMPDIGAYERIEK